MVNEETSNIAVCAAAAAELETLVSAVRQAGAWSIVPVEWPDPVAMRTAHESAHAFLLHSGASPCDELVAMLRARPERAPLIVVGAEPSPRAAPSLWLPEVPPAPLLGRLLTQLIEEAPVEAPAPAPSWRRKTDMIIGNSAAMRRLLHALDQLAPSQTPVLITGESGVGKELVARALHYCGPRAPQPFIAINCAAIPENLIEAELFGYQRGAFTGAVSAHAGAFEAADRGTLFLDEIGEMPLGMQAKLLRVLETSEIQRIGSTERKKVNFRLVSATNRTLEDEVAAGRFREDLYYRVQVYPLHVPPLRERREDIPQLVTHLLSIIGQRENRALRLTPSALEKLISYGWPGNVRELVNLLERATLLSDGRVIDAEHIMLVPGAAPPPEEESTGVLPYREAKARFEREYYARLMRTAGGNVALAARLGQKTRKEIYDALKRCGLDSAAHGKRETGAAAARARTATGGARSRREGSK